MLITTPKKQGNSQVIVLPKAILDLFQITNETEFEIHTENEELVIRSKRAKIQRAQKITNALRKIDTQYEEVFRSLANK